MDKRCVVQKSGKLLGKIYITNSSKHSFIKVFFFLFSFFKKENLLEIRTPKNRRKKPLRES